MWLEPFVLKFKVKPLMLLKLVLTLISGGPTRFITPPALRIAPNSALPPLDPSSTFSIPKSIVAPTFVPFAEKEKEKEKETPTPVVELESKEVTKVEQLKKKKNEKEKEDAA